MSTVEERLTQLENNQARLTNFFAILAKSQQEISTLALYGFSAMGETPLNEVTPVEGDTAPVPTDGLKPVLTAQPPVPQIPEEGFLDCESYVTGRLGALDMRLANQFGQMVARAGIGRGLQPKKITHPGEYWRQVNTWPIEFLREIWYMSFGETA